MKTLNYSDMGLLLRRHGITVIEQQDGVAYVLHSDGSRGEYAIEYLRAAVRRPWTERLINWLAGCAQ